MCIEKILGWLGYNTQLQSLVTQEAWEAQAQKIGTKEIPDRNPGEGRAVGLMGKSLQETVTHRDAQESVPSFQSATPEMK